MLTTGCLDILVGKLASPNPLLVLIEFIHWADRGVREASSRCRLIPSRGLQFIEILIRLNILPSDKQKKIVEARRNA